MKMLGNGFIAQSILVGSDNGCSEALTKIFGLGHD